MISSFDDFLDEGKVQVKRRYTENYPSKHVYSGAKIRNAVLSAIKDGVVTEEEFQKILDEAGASRIWKYKYNHLFDVNEDGVKLSSKGLKLCPVERIEEADKIDEVSTSIAQQRLMGMAYALKTGEMDPEDASDEVKDLAKNMTVKQLKDFASTKHKGLPYKKENESAITLPEVPGMGNVALPGNPGSTTSFDNQKAGSGDIPFPIPNKKKQIKIMKLIPESFEEFKESLINEAFAYSILQKIAKGKMHKGFFEALSKLGVAASEIQDDQVIELNPEDAKKYTAKNPDAILIYYSQTAKPNPFAGDYSYGEKTIPGDAVLAVVKNKVYMGLSSGRYTQGKTEYSLTNLKGGYSRYSPSDLGAIGKGGGKYESGLTTLDKIAIVSDAVYVIEPSLMPKSGPIKAERSKSRAGATAFVSDKEFKSANMARYNAILSDRASKMPLDKEVGDAIELLTSYIKDAIGSNLKTEYGEILVGESPKGKKLTMQDATNVMRNLLNDFGRYVQYSNEVTKEGGRYYEEESKKYAKSVTDYIRKIKNKDFAW